MDGHRWFDDNGNLISSLDHLNPRGTFTYTSVVGGGDSIEDIKKNWLASLPNILDGYAGSAMIDISNWYQNGYHLADLMRYLVFLIILRGATMHKD